jgi:single-strand DNA-binding protein
MLIGRLGKDPEVKRLENGAAVAKFTMATDESYKDKDGNKVEQTEWHNVVCWRTQAEMAEKYLKKGMLIFVEGKLTHREYQDKDNQKRHFTEVVANTFRMLERREGGNGAFPGVGDEPMSMSASRMASQPASTTMDIPAEVPTDDLPF